MWDAGHGFGLDGYEWPAVVEIVNADLGRFITAHERADLADGWRCGVRDRATYERDMAEAADQRAAERERAADAPPVATGDEIPW